MRPPYTTRPATAADFVFMRETKFEGLRPYVEALWGWNREEQERQFEQAFDPTRCDVIVVGGTDAGFVSVVDDGSAIVLGGIYLAATARRRGLGRAILLDLIDRSAAQRKPLVLQVLKTNPARSLYARLGFVTTGETASHFQMKWSADTPNG